MRQPLALKYRPKTFEDVVGQTITQRVLQRMVQSEKIHPALIFSGVRGTGKTTTGRIVAAALNCEQFPQGPCTECASCVAIESGHSLDVLEVDGATSGLVADIRQIAEMVQYSTGGRYRVVLIDEAHSMSREGFNALLKTLEEPPANTVFILLTTDPAKILDTIVSRSMAFEFTRIPDALIAERLAHIASAEGFDVSADLLAAIAQRAEGGLRNAIMMLEQCVLAEISSVDDFWNMLGENDFAPEALACLLRRDLAGALAATQTRLERNSDVFSASTALVQCLLDVVKLHARVEIVATGAGLQKREELTQSITAPMAHTALRVLWELRTRIRGTADARTVLEMSLVILMDVLAPQQLSPVATASEPPKEQPMSLDDMRRLARPKNR